MDYCLVTAGIGTRFRPFSLFANKALAPFPSKPIISILIDSIPKDATIHIVTGYLGDDLKYIISKMHNDRTLVFYENNDYLNTGMGDSLIEVLNNIDSSLIVLPNDGIYNNSCLSKIDLSDSDLIIGISNKISNNDDYCRIFVDENYQVKGYTRDEDLYIKDINSNNTSFFSFTGFLYIRDASRYKEYLISYKKREREIYFPIKDYLYSNLKVQGNILDWTDLGTYDKYKENLKNIINYDFSKKAETLLIYKDKSVFKIFKDNHISDKRITKSILYSNAFPKCQKLPGGSGYEYNFTEGQTLYEINNVYILKDLLCFLNNQLWNIKTNQKEMQDYALKFYKDKTNSRIISINKKYDLSRINSINNNIIDDHIVPSFNYNSLINKANYCAIHGDLQYDNVLYSDVNNKFTLIDWRHEFGGCIEFGDLYYDLAKLLGGIYINYKRIKDDDFSCVLNKNKTNITYSYEFDNYVDEHVSVIKDFHLENSLDFNHTKNIMSLVFLNMSPLHEAPFDLMLLALSYKFNKDNA